MADTARARKLADRIREIVAEALEKRIKDPRLGFVTVTDTRVTGDLQHATVFYTVLGDAAERTASAAALESAKGVLRSEVGRRTGVRLTPTLEFVADAVPENAAHIEDLLRTAAARDADVAALAATASYAGDPDPYRREDTEAFEEAEALADSRGDQDDADQNPDDDQALDDRHAFDGDHGLDAVLDHDRADLDGDAGGLRTGGLGTDGLETDSLGTDGFRTGGPRGDGGAVTGGPGRVRTGGDRS